MSDPVTVRILDRDYLVACEPGERDGLVSAAHLLDARMREIRGGNRMAAIDRIAVMVVVEEPAVETGVAQGGLDGRQVHWLCSDATR